MQDIQLILSDQGRGAFVIETNGERLAEMAIAISGDNLTVFHTHVNDSLRGQGVAAELLSTMVAYARKHNKKVIALCPYVSAQIQRHPDKYTDVWNRNWHG